VFVLLVGMVNSLLLEQLNAQLVLIPTVKLVLMPEQLHVLYVRTLTSCTPVPKLVKLNAHRPIATSAHLLLVLVLSVPPISPSVVVAVPHVVQLLNIMLVQHLHAQIVILVPVPLVLVLQLHARPVPLVNSCPAHHALVVIPDVLHVLEKEHAQHVLLITT